MSNKSDKLSVFISLILRHKPEVIGIEMDRFGYASVMRLILGIKNSGRAIDFEMLKEIVSSDEKGRYSFNEDMTKIRANQGHSINVEVPLRELEPPTFLYHGTSIESIDSIVSDGMISSMNRLHVHLSDNTELAIKVGARHGKPVVLIIKAKEMYYNNYKFYMSENDVWLADSIPLKYVINIKE